MPHADFLKSTLYLVDDTRLSVQLLYLRMASWVWRTELRFPALRLCLY